MLSAETKMALHGMGVREKVEARVCSKCGRHSSEVSSEHPLDEQIRKIKKRLRAEPNSVHNRKLDDKRHWLESIRHRTSRCCGAKYDDVMMNRQEAQWNRWQRRLEDVQAIVVPRIREKRPNLSESQLLQAAIQFMRNEYGAKAKNHDDDFIMISYLWGQGDRAVARYLQIFRREERIRLENPIAASA
jgi:hypothetical protein